MATLAFNAQTIHRSTLVKYIAYVFSFCFILTQPLFAAEELNRHHYPVAEKSETKSLTKDGKTKYFGCDIEIINDSYSSVVVSGYYDDRLPLIPFRIYSFEFSHYIDMFYSGYCHAWMYLTIETFDGYPIFSNYVYTGSTIHIVPWLYNAIKANVENKRKNPANI